MEKYCTTLEKSKELEANAWKKETKFYHVANKNVTLPEYKDCVLFSRRLPELEMYPKPYWNYYSSPLAAEILEELNNDTIIKYISEIPNNEEICLGCIIMNLLRSPDLLADCWIWAKKNGLVE